MIVKPFHRFKRESLASGGTGHVTSERARASFDVGFDGRIRGPFHLSEDTDRESRQRVHRDKSGADAERLTCHGECAIKRSL